MVDLKTDLEAARGPGAVQARRGWVISEAKVVGMSDVLEGNKFQIETKVDRGGVDLLSFFRDKKTLKATYDFTLTEGAAKPLDQMVVEVKDK